jgi:1,2-diacylglycerol 3-alpha-glucosyltransferase
MRVAFFTDTYLPNVDGVVTSICNYRSELEKRGNQVFVFSAASGGNGLSEDKKVFFYRSVPLPFYPQYKIAVFPFSAYRDVRKSKAELIHSHAIAGMGLAAIASAKQLGLPLLGTFHTMLPEAVRSYAPIGKNISERVAWKAISSFYSPFDLVTAPTHVIRTMLEEHGVERTRVLPNGVDCKRFNPGVKSLRQEFGNGKKIVLVGGRLSLEKNVDLVVRSAKRVLKEEDAIFLVHGEGPAKKSVEALVKQLGLQKNFVFSGFVPPQLLPNIYASCDCIVNASVFETQCLAFLEAMACGRVPVGANALAIPEIVKDGKNGFLFEPFDEQECAGKIIQALSLPEKKRKAMKKTARETALKYSVEKTTDALERIYGELL